MRTPALKPLLPLVSWAQDAGAVSGIVVSTWDGTPVGGATITVRGTTLAAQTDSTGKYQLNSVPPGEQVLRFSKSGFAAVVVTDVRVIPGQTTTVNGNLRPEFYEMEEFEVTAEEFQQQTEQIIFERQNSSSMMDAIGSERLSSLGVNDAAAALGKVTGASVAAHHSLGTHGEGQRDGRQHRLRHQRHRHADGAWWSPADTRNMWPSGWRRWNSRTPHGSSVGGIVTV